MRNILVLVATVAAACPAPAGAETGRHIVGITEGAAHRKADAECRPLGERARVHMFLNNGLAFECIDPATGAGDPPQSLTYGPL
jgi:hypothetical protein